MEVLILKNHILAFVAILLPVVYLPESACDGRQSLCYLLERRRLGCIDTGLFCWNQWQCSGVRWFVFPVLLFLPS